MYDYHVPVLLKESIEFLNVLPGKRYIDATFGGGGHSRAILEKGGLVLGIDQDIQALENAERNFKSEFLNSKLVLKHGNFAHLKEIWQLSGFGPISGIIFDLGVSSHQLETASRGFSFGKEAKLDMRMDQSMGVTAADLLNAGSEKELASLFFRFGQEREANKIAKEIVYQRSKGKIETTQQLADIILKVRRRGKDDRTHPATRVFQALRIAVNDELSSLENALSQTVELLEQQGRLVVISFHSLEDRIVKNFLNTNRNEFNILTKKVVKPSKLEIMNNAKSRSGKLRAAIRI